MADQRALDALTGEVLQGRIGRRALMKRAVLLGISGPTLAMLLAACGDDDDDDDEVDVPGEEDEDDEEPTEEDVDDDEDEDEPDDEPDDEDDDDADAGEVRDVARERTLILRWGGQEGRYIDHELWNGYAIGANHQNGLGILHEPLAYYSAFADEMIPWLAESWEYSADATELTITTRSGITWSDGVPFTAEDVAFTLTSLRDLGPEVRWGVDVSQFVESAEAVDDNTVRVRFVVPAPRFFYFMTYKYDIGVYIIPKHIFENEDWTVSTNFDIEAGLPVTTGPWRVVFSSPEQKIIDRRNEWWAADAGLAELPRVERVIYLPFADEGAVVQQLITNQIDCSLDLRPLNMELALRDNPSITTHSGDRSPYGYVDWWPTALYVNHDEEPFDDPDIRWAISNFINREQIIEVGYAGAGSFYPLPVPSYPGLQPFVDNVRDILEEYDTLEFNPDKGAELLESKGFARNSNGMWERDGEVLGMTINGWTVFADIGPIIAEQLRQQGVDAEYAQPPNWSDMLQQGNYVAGLAGHGGSVSGDPYFTLRLFQSATVAVPGAHLVNFTKWVNEEYDAIVDEMAVTSLDDTDALMDQFRRAMEIWIPELPNIQIQEWYHRIPMNQTFWVGWPTEDDPYVNGAFWHLTFQLVLNRLDPA